MSTEPAIVFCELEGIPLDEAVARAIGEEPGADYSTSWHHGGPLLKRFGIGMSPPESPVHRNGGRQPGWGKSGLWCCTSYIMLQANGRRGFAYHPTNPLAAAMRLIVQCKGPR